MRLSPLLATAGLGLGLALPAPAAETDWNDSLHTAQATAEDIDPARWPPR